VTVIVIKSLKDHLMGQCTYTVQMWAMSHSIRIMAWLCLLTKGTTGPAYNIPSYLSFCVLWVL